MTKISDLHRRWSKDADYRDGYDTLPGAFDLAHASIQARTAAGLSQSTDRAKDLVKSGGEWISTVALESAPVEHPGVAEAVVVAVPHPRWGERPLAVIVPKPGCAPTIDALRAHLAPKVAKWWLPDAVVHVESLPRTGTGKYQKNVVRAAHKDHFATIAAGGDVAAERPASPAPRITTRLRDPPAPSVAVAASSAPSHGGRTAVAPAAMAR
jgi:acyl-coenzyme A synthetase/AMP-(fatty) acid ligase